MKQEAKELLWTYVLLLIVTLAACLYTLGVMGCSEVSTAPYTTESDLFGEPIVLDTLTAI